jgi:hypothetical protein
VLAKLWCRFLFCFLLLLLLNCFCLCAVFLSAILLALWTFCRFLACVSVVCFCFVVVGCVRTILLLPLPKFRCLFPKQLYPCLPQSLSPSLTQIRPCPCVNFAIVHHIYITLVCIAGVCSSAILCRPSPVFLRLFSKVFPPTPDKISLHNYTHLTRPVPIPVQFLASFVLLCFCAVTGHLPLPNFAPALLVNCFSNCPCAFLACSCPILSPVTCPLHSWAHSRALMYNLSMPPLSHAPEHLSLRNFVPPCHCEVFQHLSIHLVTLSLP